MPPIFRGYLRRRLPLLTNASRQLTMLVDALCQSKSEHPDAFGQDGPAKGCGYTLACSLFVPYIFRATELAGLRFDGAQRSRGCPKWGQPRRRTAGLQRARESPESSLKFQVADNFKLQRIDKHRQGHRTAIERGRNSLLNRKKFPVLREFALPPPAPPSFPPPLAGEGWGGGIFRYPRFGGGRSRRRCSSRRRSGRTGAGAPIIRSRACWFIGKTMTSRMFGVSAKSMTMRSMPGARPPCGGAP